VKKKRNLRKRLAKAVSYSRTRVRMKHFRGRKVHSPFVYGIVRNAIMKTRPQGDDHALFDELRTRGFSAKRAAQLQNLYDFRGYDSVIFAEHKDSLSTLPPSAFPAPPLCGDSQASVGEPRISDARFNFQLSTLCFLMPSLSAEDTFALVEQARGTGAALCLVWPHESRDRRRLARSLVSSHGHTSVDNRGFLLLFTDRRLPKQHFKL
jgi:hypothetical protein